MSKSSRSRAFTLVELLVVIAIIGILVALLLPAIQAARGAALRNSCQNKIRQVMLSMLNHVDAHKRLPHGSYNYIGYTGFTTPLYGTRFNRKGWVQDVMPFLEESSLGKAYDSWSAANPTKYAYEFPGSGTAMPIFMCPSDPLGLKDAGQGFHGNYVGCAGNEYMRWADPTDKESASRPNGSLYAISKVKPKDFVDGTSKTIVVGEILLTSDDAGHDIRGRYYNNPHGGTLFTTLYTPMSPIQDRLPWVTDSNPAAPASFQGGNMMQTLRSGHTTGVNTANADGSSTFVTDDIDALVYRGMGSRNGGEIVSK